MNEPVVIAGGFLTEPGDYLPWIKALSKPPYSRKVFVSSVGRLKWALTRDESFQPQIVDLAKVIKIAIQSTGAEKVWLIGHSAGGRIGRLWMGERPYGGLKCNGHRFVRGLISLGSPYTTKEPWATKSAAYANKYYPGAYYPDITYVAAIGKSIFPRRHGSPAERFAYQSYKLQWPENPNQWGDGFITIDGAYMPGAENHVLDGIYHYNLFGRIDYSHPSATKVWAKHLEQEA
ncbi:hypothetical protein [Candidatus Chlorohelix sp.]|uniref:esterase/lipase family protein n=1 Tax=Candidatus Chlorohelix sp. TaxID=3139201 RepID=UPI0030697D8D